MNLNLTSKERALLEDQKSQKYVLRSTNYTNQTQCPELKQMFQTFAREQQHLNTINSMLSGKTLMYSKISKKSAAKSAAESAAGPVSSGQQAQA